MVARENLPMYVHDLDGSDAVSIMGAALRKLQGWSPSSYAAEMSRYVTRSVRSSSSFFLFLF